MDDKNFLKSNDEKTVLLDIGVYKSPVVSLKLTENVELVPSHKAKNLGFVFDHQLNLNEQIKALQKVCNMKLRDLRRISGRLSTELRIQLAHSCILSFVDYCNGAYGLLSESNLKSSKKYKMMQFVLSLVSMAIKKVATYITTS